MRSRLIAVSPGCNEVLFIPLKQCTRALVFSSSTLSRSGNNCRFPVSVAIMLPALVLLVSLFFWWRSRRTCYFHLDNVNGPHAKSWLVGNLREIHRGNAGAQTLAWVKQYGRVVRTAGILGEPTLLVSDQYAIKYILSVGSGSFVRAEYRRRQISNLLGPGLSAMEGQDHTRQRRIMQPAMNFGAVCNLLPVFRSVAERLTEAIELAVLDKAAKVATVANGYSLGSNSAVVDMHHFIMLATFDAMSEGCFGVPSNSLAVKKDTDWGSLLSLTLLAAFANPSNFEFMLGFLLPRMPDRLYRAWFYGVPTRGHRVMRQMRERCLRVAGDIVAKRQRLLDEGDDPGNDALSLMMKANRAEDPRRRLSEAELRGQVNNLLAAGHEATAHGLGWILYELAKNPDIQERVRAEIREAKAKKGSELDASDLNDLSYLNAVFKEVSRIHPAVFSTGRQSTADAILPLTKPILARDGKTWLDRVPLPAGTSIEIDIYSYNMDPDLWHEPEVFRPERWLEGKDVGRRGPGLFDGLMNFVIGKRACIGWKFSIVETQQFLVQLLDKFAFEPAPDVTVAKYFNFFVAAYSAGKFDEGMQLELKVTVL